jgi:hypothetical protein
MTLKRLALMALLTYGLLALWAWTGSTSNTETLYAPSVPATVTLGMLTAQQLEDRAEELTETTTTTSTQPVTTLAPFDPDTKCQEWFQTAITVGWPNNTETLEKLGRLLWKETRCLNVSYTHPSFNGHDHGVAQINQVHRAYVEQLFSGTMEESMSDPTLNLRLLTCCIRNVSRLGSAGGNRGNCVKALERSRSLSRYAH